MHGLSIRTVCTDGIGRFQSVNDRKIASINWTYKIFQFSLEARDCHGRLIRTVSSFGIGGFQSFTISENRFFQGDLEYEFVAEFSQ